MGWSLGYPYSDDDVWTLDMSVEEWKSALVSGDSSHVYLYNVDKQFRSRFGQLFEYESAISNNSAFEVDTSGGQVVLKRVY